MQVGARARPATLVVALAVLLALTVLLALAGCARPEHRGEVTSVIAGPSGAVMVTVVEGATQTVWSVGEDGQILARAEPGSAPAGGGATEACAGADCYRVAAGRLAVERSQDSGATYRIEWEVNGGTYDGLAAAYPALGDPAVHLSSVAIVVRPLDWGHVVFVANGRDGLLFRDAVGRWRRLGAQAPHYATPPALRPGVGIAGQVAAAAGGVVFLAAGATIARRRSVRPLRAVLAIGIAALVAVIGYVGSGLPDLASVTAGVYASALVITATIGGAAMAIAILTGPPDAREQTR